MAVTLTVRRVRRQSLQRRSFYQDLKLKHPDCDLASGASELELRQRGQTLGRDYQLYHLHEVSWLFDKRPRFLFDLHGSFLVSGTECRNWVHSDQRGVFETVHRHFRVKFRLYAEDQN